MARMNMGDLKKFLNKRENQTSTSKNYSGDIYPFWNMQPNEHAVIRFLPDGDSENPLPFIEKLEHVIPVNGQMRKIPCPRMYNKKCPICDLSQEYYKAEGDGSDNGKYYYRKRMHLAKALVIEDPLPKDAETGESFVGKVVTVQLGYQLYERIMEQLSSFFDDDDEVPWHPTEGFNFSIKKVTQGKYEKYDIGSTFARKSSPIPDEYLKDLELVALSSILPTELSFDEVNSILDAHLSGGSTGEDSLESKKKKSSRLMNEDSVKGESNTRSALSRLSGDFEEEEDEDEDESVSENTSSDDDDDDDDDDLKALINRAKNRNK